MKLKQSDLINVEDQICDRVGFEARTQVWDQASFQVCAQVWNQTRAKVTPLIDNQVLNQNRSQIYETKSK